MLPFRFCSFQPIAARTCKYRWLVLGVLLVGCGSQDDTNSRAVSTSAPAIHTRMSLDEALVSVQWNNLDEEVVRKIERAQAAVRADEASANNWGHLGMLLLAHDLERPGANCFETAAALDAGQARWPYYQAIALRNLQPQLALQQLRRAVELFGPQYIAPQLRLAEALIEAAEFDEAETILSRVARIEPNNNGARVALGKLQLLRNEPRECLESLRGVLQQERPWRKSLLLAAEAYRRLNALEVAERQRELAQVAPDASWPDPIYSEVLALRSGLTTQLSKADRLFVQNRVDESLRLLEQITTDHPDSEWAQILLARSLIRKRHLPEGAKP